MTIRGLHALPDRPGLLRWIGGRALGAALLLAALEAWLFHWGHYGRLVVAVRDADLGWILLPGQHRAVSGDLVTPEAINSYGFRDREWAAPEFQPDGSPFKAPGVFRVAVLGDAISYGPCVSLEDTWPRRLEALLAEELRARARLDPRTPEPVVMNFSVGGYVLEQMARCYERTVRDWRPDVVIFALHAQDVEPFAEIPRGAPLWLQSAILRSAIYDYLDEHVIERWVPRPEAERLPDRGERHARDELLRTAPFSPELEPLWDAAARRLDGVRQRVESDGGHLAIACMPHLAEIDVPPPSEAERFWASWSAARRTRSGAPATACVELAGPFAAAMPALARELAARGFRAGAADNGQLPAGLEHEAESPFLPFDTLHFSARGHALAAQAVFDELAASGWL
jgi:lysophospholipase L1-like esterase